MSKNIKNTQLHFCQNLKQKTEMALAIYIIMKSLKTQDNKLITVAKNFKRLISYIKIAENKEIIGHLTTKTILKRKEKMYVVFQI